MKRAAAILLAVLLTAAFASCKAINIPVGTTGGSPSASVSAGLSSPTLSPSPTPSATDGYINLGFEVPYATVEPVNPDKALELRIALPKDMASPQVVAMPGGGALALGLQATEKKGDFNGPSRLMAARYDGNGDVLWVKVYDELPEGYQGFLQPFGDGFVFTYSVPDSNNSRLFIVFCGGDGQVAYRESGGQIMMYQYILDGSAEGAGAVVVGDAMYKDGKPVRDGESGGGEEMLSILAQGMQSSVFFSRALGLPEYFSPLDAICTREAGLVVSALKKGSTDGNVSEILSIDLKTLTLQWRYGREAEGNRYMSDVAEVPGGILVSGFDGRPYILKLDNNGKKLWEIEPDKGDYSVIALAALPDGRFVAAINRYKEGDPNRGVYLALYGENGALIQKAQMPPNVTPLTLLPAGDGELLCVGVQAIKTLPQPAYVSSIWYDTETIVTKYDGELNIQWRKVYDRYKDSTRRDIAVPAEDGRVIVEK